MELGIGLLCVFAGIALMIHGFPEINICSKNTKNIYKSK